MYCFFDDTYQARTQTFEKKCVCGGGGGGAGGNLWVFTRGGANLKKILILRPRLGAQTVSGEKLHRFEIICLDRGGGGGGGVPSHP